MLGGQYGNGGGKLGKGAYHYDLGTFAIDADNDEIIRERMWDFINEREVKRLLKIIKK